MSRSQRAQLFSILEIFSPSSAKVHRLQGRKGVIARREEVYGEGGALSPNRTLCMDEINLKWPRPVQPHARLAVLVTEYVQLQPFALDVHDMTAFANNAEVPRGGWDCG